MSTPTRMAIWMAFSFSPSGRVCSWPLMRIVAIEISVSRVGWGAPPPPFLTSEQNLGGPGPPRTARDGVAPRPAHSFFRGRRQDRVGDGARQDRQRRPGRVGRDAMRDRLLEPGHPVLAHRVRPDVFLEL